MWNRCNQSSRVPYHHPVRVSKYKSNWHVVTHLDISSREGSLIDDCNLKCHQGTWISWSWGRRCSLNQSHVKDTVQAKVNGHVSTVIIGIILVGSIISRRLYWLSIRGQCNTWREYLCTLTGLCTIVIMVFSIVRSISYSR